MFPYIKLGPLTLGSYGVLIVIGFALGVFVAVMRRKLYGLEAEEDVYKRQGLQSEKRGMGIAGLVLSIIGFVICLINSAIGAYLGATGQLF